MDPWCRLQRPCRRVDYVCSQISSRLRALSAFTITAIIGQRASCADRWRGALAGDRGSALGGLRALRVPGEGSLEVESRMGAVAWGLWPALRFPSPLIKPSVPISGTRLSDWLHHKAHDGRPLDAGVQRRHPGTRRIFVLRYELPLTGPDRSRCLQAHRQSPSPRRLQKHAKKSGPFAPPALPGFNAHTTLSDSRHGRCLPQR
jgi:hypothetical protein